MLKAFEHFAPFLTLAGVLVLIGSALFLLLPANPVVADSAEENSAKENSLLPARVREGAAG
jgi:hypothetical protein